MAKRKRSGKIPQPRHRAKGKPSQHDKRSRLQKSNLNRRHTTQASIPLVGGPATIAGSLSRMLDSRIAFRLPIVMAGALLASGRRTAASWFRCAEVKDDWDLFYDLLQSVGRNAATVMYPLIVLIFKRFDPGPDGHWTLAVDDSPTKRFGPCIEGANIHHNPTPGPADGDWLYGHNWVCLAIILSHPIFGVIALPLLSLLYVREVDIAKLNARYGWRFRTKHELALDLFQRTMIRLRALGSQARFIIVFDGAYVAANLVRPLLESGATVVSRLRSDAKLFDLPVQTIGQRGRPRKYGKNRISLKKRAGNRHGWQTIVFPRRGAMTEGRYKTFLATSHVVGGTIRVVLVEYGPGNWAAYFSTDQAMSVETILQTVSDRWPIEEYFHDVKEVWGAGKQQVRNVWSNIGCWNLCGWMYSMIELECWDRTSDQLVDRRDRPWDNPERRPSHADRRRYLAREMLRKEFLADLETSMDKQKILQHFETLMALAA